MTFQILDLMQTADGEWNALVNIFRACLHDEFFPVEAPPWPVPQSSLVEHTRKAGVISRTVAPRLADRNWMPPW